MTRAKWKGVLAPLIFLLLPFGLLYGSCVNEKEATFEGNQPYKNLDEASGLVASRAYPSLLWSHNDHGGRPRIYGFTIEGEKRGVFHIDGAKNQDWEDIALAPCYDGEGDCLYIGDIGDNDLVRDHLYIYVVREPAPLHSLKPMHIPLLRKLKFKVKGGRQNFEAMTYFPKSKQLILFSKGDNFSGKNHLSRAYELDIDKGLQAKSVGTFDFKKVEGFEWSGYWYQLATAADISPDGKYLLIGTYGHAIEFPLKGGKHPFGYLKNGKKIIVPSQPQSEAITYTADGEHIITTSEYDHQPIYKVYCR